ncbi:MAG: RNA polymerase subunit sigma-70 [Chryseobacterium sp.]|nr:MAG: RNA polymerase subunit sigma-70 [Chryseobacterium sp.]
MNSDKSNIFIATIEAHKGIVYKISNLYCRDDDDRKDLVQEILFQLWKSFDNYDKQYKYSTWIYRIALNVAISFYRKEKSRTKLSSPLSENILQRADTHENASFDEKTALLWDFLNTLKELDKAIMLLYLEGKNHKEIAEIIGITETNVSTKINRIKNLLKQKFSQITL